MKLSSAAKLRHKGRKLLSTEIMDCSGRCPLCHSARPRESVLQLQQSPAIALLHCADCLGVSASHMPIQEVIDGTYKDFYIESDDEKYTFHGIERLATQIMQYVRVSPDQQCFRVLEIGGGDGTLVRDIGRRLCCLNERMQVEMCEVELYKGDCVSGEGVPIEYFDDLSNVEGKFDLVIASAVLHQIPEGYKCLRGLFDHVSQGGIFFARTAFLLPFVRLFGPFFDSLYPYHVHDMGCEFWNQVTSSFSLPAKVIHSRPSLVELQVRRSPVRALVAHALKLPATIELCFAQHPDKNPIWKFVGGWEVALQFNE